MSGGNPYEISDFSVSSKWFFNWVEDSSIIKMQPEGSTTECLTCVSSGTFNIKAFDMRDRSPTSSDILGIHIPIFADFDDRYKTNVVFSYWISYRSGVDGDASNGISIHLAWFELYGLSGSYHDSIRYDSMGHTETKFDSFVKENSCYQVSPLGFIRDRDYVSAEAVQPVICVGDINPGDAATVSISFIDAEKLPPSKVDLVEHPTVDCALQTGSIQKYVDSSRYNLFHFENPDNNGLLHVSLDTSDSSESTAYIYDR